MYKFDEDKLKSISPSTGSPRHRKLTLSPVKSKTDGGNVSSELSGSSGRTEMTTNATATSTTSLTVPWSCRQQKTEGFPMNSKAPQNTEAKHPCSLSPSTQSHSSAVSSRCGSILIRPISRLLTKRLWQISPIPVDQLEQSDRDLYLRDFLPPDPTTCGKQLDKETGLYTRQRKKHLNESGSYSSSYTNPIAMAEKRDMDHTRFPDQPTPLDKNKIPTKTIEIIDV